MTTNVLRPNGSSASIPADQPAVGAATQWQAASDDLDSSYVDNVTAGYRTTNFALTTFSLPAGNVVKTLALRVRVAGTPGAAGPGQSNLYAGARGVVCTVTEPVDAGAIIVRTSNVATLSSAMSQAEIDALNVDYSTGTFSGGHKLYEMYVDVVHAAPPVTSAITITPATPITTTRKPTIGWTYVQGSDGSAQTWFRVKIFSAAQYGIGGFDPAASPNTYDSGDVNSAAASHVLSSNLANGVTYKAYVLTYQTTSSTNQPSAWVASTAFTLAIVVPTPTAVTPAAASTVTSSRPSLGASVGAMTSGSLMRREWQFASDAGFTTALLTVTEDVSGLTATPSAPVGFPALPTRRAQGVWFIRARALDQDGVYGPYTAGQSFTIAHAPGTTSRLPSSGGTIVYSATPTVNWVFSDIDTDDYQTKFQVLLWKTSTPGTVLDSGLIVSAAQLYQFTAGIDATWKNTELRWKVQVYDQDNVTAGYSIENTFYLRDLPVVTVVPAAAAVVTTASPLVTWTNVFSGGATQVQFKVDIIRASVTLETSGWLSSTSLQYQVTTPVVTVGPTHQVTVTVIDSNGLQGTTTNNFTAAYAASTVPVFTIDASGYAAGGLNIIDWSTATADANFYSWKVLRRNVGTVTWTKLLETQTVGTRSYRDFLSPANQPVEYVVVQTDISIGSVLVESVYAPLQTSSTTTRYMLVCPSLESLNVTLYQVHTDSFGDEVEHATVNLIGRGRRVEYGSRYGQIGSLTASLRDIPGGLTARAQRLKIEALRQSQRIVYFRNPFGDVFQTAMDSAQFERVSGVGILEYTDVTIAYQEITA